jgi:hypothetical protein
LSITSNISMILNGTENRRSPHQDSHIILTYPNISERDQSLKIQSPQKTVMEIAGICWIVREFVGWIRGEKPQGLSSAFHLLLKSSHIDFMNSKLKFSGATHG